MFDPNQQGPKSDQELVDLYGYDIRQEEGAPRFVLLCYINWLFYHRELSLFLLELAVVVVMAVVQISTIVLGKTRMHIRDPVVVVLLGVGHLNEGPQVVHHIVELGMTAVLMSVHAQYARKFRERKIFRLSQTNNKSLKLKERTVTKIVLVTGETIKIETMKVG